MKLSWFSSIKRWLVDLELTPVRITIIYIAFGLLALYLFDIIFVFYLPEPLLSRVQLVKGAVEVVLTAGIIFALTTRSREQVRETSRELERHREELQVLHRVFRHNLRNDLNVVLIYADLAREQAPEGPVASMCDQIVKTTRDITDYAERTQRIRQVPNFDRHTFDLTPTLRGVIENAQNGRQDVQLVTDVPDGLAVRANAMFDEALDELVTNAIEYSHSDSATVRIVVDPEGGPPGMMEIRIEDDGPGIPEYEIESLSAPDQNQLLHPTGLGLWFADWVVSHSDGTLTVESGPSGTHVSLLVPAATGDEMTNTI